MKYTAIIEGERIDIEISETTESGIQAKIGGRRYFLETRRVGPGVFWFNWNGRSIEVSVTPNGDAYAVSIGGRQVAVELVDGRAALRKAAQHRHAGAVELRAPMPGKVVKVLLREGAPVQPNQGILVMEAMKMQNEIKSPKTGIVKTLSVMEGVAVNAGDLLAIVE